MKKRIGLRRALSAFAAAALLIGACAVSGGAVQAKAQETAASQGGAGSQQEAAASQDGAGSQQEAAPGQDGAGSQQETAASQGGAGSQQETAADGNREEKEMEAASKAGTAVGTDAAVEIKDGLKWWQKTNVCEIYVRSFQDSDGDGIGDLKGITSRLDYLKELGIGAIWLTPCYRSPQADNGYDVADYYEIDEIFGTMEDMDELIAKAKERGILIVMDLVFNHTSDQNEWFLESASGKDNPKSDWYIWRDAGPDGSAPTNWRSIFVGSAWTWSETRGQYYLHTFLKEQPDLNWENPEVRNALYDVAKFWLDKGVGGFRMDAVTYIKKPAFVDGEPDAGDGMAAIHTMTANTDGILDFLHEFKDEVQSGRDIFTVGEANGVSAPELPLWVGNDGVFDMVFEFSHMLIDLKDETNWADRREWTLADLKKILDDSQKNTAENGWYPVFFANHDQPRCIDHFFPNVRDAENAGKVIGTLMFTLRGTPFVYQGQELGFRNVKWGDISDYNDVSTKNHYDFLIEEGYSKEEAMEAIHHFSRDSARTPMQWTTEENAGFTTGTPWLPINDNYMTVNAASEKEDPDSILSWYRALSEIRSSHSELTEGSYEEILHEHGQIYAFIRKGTSSEAIILTNFSEEAADYDASILDGAQLVISSAKEPVPGTLAPLESAIYERPLSDR